MVTIEGFGGKRALGFLLKIELCRISHAALFRCVKQCSVCFFAEVQVLRLRDITYAKKPVFVISSARDRKDDNFT